MQHYPGRLAHHTPSWVKTGATFHIRIRISPEAGNLLTVPSVAAALLASVQQYHDQRRWNCRLFLLMPDHLHALLVFPHDQAMGVILAAWKGFHAKHLGIKWQNNFFDHRIRDHGELEKSAAYIRLNPVRRALCHAESEWPWVISCVAETRPEAGFHPRPPCQTKTPGREAGR